VNVLGLLLVLPPFLDFYARKLLGERKYELSNLFSTIAAGIGELMNIIPGNPYAAGLPFFLMMQLVTLNKLEDAATAEKVARRLLKYYNAQKDVHPMRIAHATVLLGTALSQQGRYEESEKATRDAIAIFEQQQGVRPVKIAASLADLCATLAREGKSKPAIDIGSKALRIMENSPGEEQRDLILLGMTLNNLAVAYNYAGQPEKALELYERSLKIKLRLFGEKSKEAVIGFNNVGFALLEMDQFAKSAESLEKAKQVAHDLGLQNTAIWPNIICNCGDVHRALGRFDEADKELQEALKLREKTKGHKDLHESYHCLGKYYRDIKDYPKSEQYFQKALSLREKQFGPDHSKVSNTLREYAQLLRQCKRETEAETIEARVAAIKAELEK
jgi:tetratricopeptide (TPR) repeat protein